MTKKRFTLKESDIYNRNDVIHDNGIEMPQSTVCDLLNSLNEENVKLRARNKYLATKIQKENEQLKQQLQQLQHWNNCLAEKRHQELSYKPYTASKSEKELKELLESKLFNCSDR